MDSMEDKIISIMQAGRNVNVYSPGHFKTLGALNAVNVALSRLAKGEKIIRLSKGLYLYPKQHKLLGTLFPSAEEVAHALAKRDKIKIIPTGATALQKLGLSTQAPLRLEYLTDGSPKRLRYQTSTIVFKRTSPKYMTLKAEISKLVIIALKELEKEDLDKDLLHGIDQRLKLEEVKHIKHDMQRAPAWISEVLHEHLKTRLQDENTLDQIAP